MNAYEFVWDGGMIGSFYYKYTSFINYYYAIKLICENNYVYGKTEFQMNLYINNIYYVNLE